MCASTQRRRTARRAIESVRNEFDRSLHAELARIVEIWADTALKLDARDLKMMDRLVRSIAAVHRPLETIGPNRSGWRLKGATDLR
jgi:hypothetical protein